MISPRRIALIITVVVVCLTLASLAGQYSKYILGHDTLKGFVRLSDVNHEANIPTWYSSSALLFCSLLLARIASAKKIEGAGYVVHWSALSLIFAFLSLDETASIHEMGTIPLQSMLSANGFFYFAWIIPGAGFVLIVVLAYLRFLAHLPRPTRRLFLAAGALFVGGAIGVEAFGGRHIFLYGGHSMTYAMIVTLEEFLEMLGIVVFIYALTSYMSSHIKDLRDGIEEKY